MKSFKKVFATTAVALAVGTTTLIPTQSFASEKPAQVTKATQKAQAFDQKLE
ncbi:hypothetical protein P8864_21780 [Priestia flexa]|uniref:hypothetical protein n=1 Tax=Priestia flexa TaxID=86664 RepID=UPI000CA77C96|nr:hypothetical protein [Priestia flexa]MEC0668473.1 hypothetical protein [Priestia flexa]MED3825797.1 hypothetical protein [Priestia flexa]